MTEKKPHFGLKSNVTPLKKYPIPNIFIAFMPFKIIIERYGGKILGVPAVREVILAIINDVSNAIFSIYRNLYYVC